MQSSGGKNAFVILTFVIITWYYHLKQGPEIEQQPLNLKNLQQRQTDLDLLREIRWNNIKISINLMHLYALKTFSVNFATYGTRSPTA